MVATNSFTKAFTKYRLLRLLWPLCLSIGCSAIFFGKFRGWNFLSKHPSWFVLNHGICFFLYWLIAQHFEAVIVFHSFNKEWYTVVASYTHSRKRSLIQLPTCFACVILAEMEFRNTILFQSLLHTLPGHFVDHENWLSPQSTNGNMLKKPHP